MKGTSVNSMKTTVAVVMAQTCYSLQITLVEKILEQATEVPKKDVFQTTVES